MHASTSRLRAAVLGALLAGSATAVPAAAAEATEHPEQASRQSNIGFVTGLAVGALAAGPVGAVVGAATGVVLGDRYHRQARSVEQLNGALAQARAAGGQLDQTLQRTDDIGLDVSFRTNDDSVTAQAMPPLLKLGALAASIREARLRVDGYADPRGSDAWNQDLSRRRAQNVAAVLVAAGVTPERLLIEAHGKSEAASADGDLDAYALERRVTVRLQLQDPGAADPGQVARRD